LFEQRICISATTFVSCKISLYCLNLYYTLGENVYLSAYTSDNQPVTYRV